MAGETSPFSLAEFGRLVSSALQVDATFPDNLQLSINPFSYTSSSSSSSSSSLLPRPPIPPPSTRSRQMFDRIRKHASALVARPPHPCLRDDTRSLTPPPAKEHFHPIPTISLLASSKNSIYSLSQDEDDTESDYIPYLPLAVQHERAFPHSFTRAPNASTSSLLRHHSTGSSRSRSPSILTITSDDRRSIDSASTATEPHSPITPQSPLFFTASSQSHGSSSPSIASTHEHNRWSICTDNDEVSPAAAGDPFAKGHVQIVNHYYQPLHPYATASPRTSYHGASTPSSRRVSRRRSQQSRTPRKSPKRHPRRHTPSPTPPPSGPLPHLPATTTPFASSRSPCSGSNEPSEWTLRLGVRNGSVVTVNDAASIATSCQSDAAPEQSTSVPVPKLVTQSAPSTPRKTATDGPALPQAAQDWTLSLPIIIVPNPIPGRTRTESAMPALSSSAPTTTKSPRRALKASTSDSGLRVPNPLTSSCPPSRSASPCPSSSLLRSPSPSPSLSSASTPSSTSQTRPSRVRGARPIPAPLVCTPMNRPPRIDTRKVAFAGVPPLTSSSESAFSASGGNACPSSASSSMIGFSQIARGGIGKIASRRAPWECGRGAGPVMQPVPVVFIPESGPSLGVGSDVDSFLEVDGDDDEPETETETEESVRFASRMPSPVLSVASVSVPSSVVERGPESPVLAHVERSSRARTRSTATYVDLERACAVLASHRGKRAAPDGYTKFDAERDDDADSGCDVASVRDVRRVVVGGEDSSPGPEDVDGESAVYYSARSSMSWAV